MANEEHLKILKQGVEAWNAWRGNNLEVRPDLRDADLRGADLRGANLTDADLRDANLTDADLRDADLTDAIVRAADLTNADLRNAILLGDLRDADLTNANLRDADLTDADLTDADLRGANLRGADLRDADLRGADFFGAYLRDADLRGADLLRGDLRGADLRGTMFASTTVTSIDLRWAKGLESINHHGPSALSIDVLQESRGQIPTAFLRGCGLSDWEIEAAKLYNPDLSSDKRTDILYEIERLQGEQPLALFRLFLSYSHQDRPFLEQLEPQLDKQGIRYWRDVHGMRTVQIDIHGMRIAQIGRALTLHPLVLLVLSEHSVESDWVEWEFRKARKLAKERGRDVLCPVTLDDAWQTCRWPGPVRQQIEDYHVLDFSDWQDEVRFQEQMGKLFDGLTRYYQPTIDLSGWQDEARELRELKEKLIEDQIEKLIDYQPPWEKEEEREPKEEPEPEEEPEGQP